MTAAIQKCAKGHSHYKVPWTIYVLDPEQSSKVDTYRDGLYPLAVFDTVEEVKNLYNLEAFAKPNGPPSWSLVVPQGTIAGKNASIGNHWSTHNVLSCFLLVFLGGKFGYPAVKPAWEDPATSNGNIFSDKPGIIL